MKKIACLFLLISFCLFVFSSKQFADEERKSVYCVGDEAEYVYEIANNKSDFSEILNTNGLSLSRDHIMPVYAFNLLDYAWEDELTVYPDICNAHSEKEEISGNIYIAKLEWEDREYAGYVKFCIEDDYAYLHVFTPTILYEKRKGIESARWIDEYVDYSDNEEIINQVFQNAETVDPTMVRLVTEPRLGIGYFISFDNREDVFIYCKSIVEEQIQPPKYYLADGELKQIAEKELDSFLETRKWYERRYSEWEKEHPGETVDLVGFGPYPIHYMDDKISTTDGLSDVLEGQEFSQTEDAVECELKPGENQSGFIGDISELKRENNSDIILTARTNKEKNKSDNADWVWMVSVISGALLIILLSFFSFRKNMH